VTRKLAAITLTRWRHKEKYDPKKITADSHCLSWQRARPATTAGSTNTAGLAAHCLSNAVVHQHGTTLLTAFFEYKDIIRLCHNGGDD